MQQVGWQPVLEVPVLFKYGLLKRPAAAKLYSNSCALLVKALLELFFKGFNAVR